MKHAGVDEKENRTLHIEGTCRPSIIGIFVYLFHLFQLGSKTLLYSELNYILLLSKSFFIVVNAF
jgi:hypothetical protein